MNIRFVSSRVHGVLDYVAAVGLIAYPILLGFSGIALWFSVIGGVGLIGYSLLTDYAFSMVRAFSFKMHLTLDLVAGAGFIAAIFLFGFQGLTAAYYAIMGLGVFALVAVTEPGTDSIREVTGDAAL